MPEKSHGALITFMIIIGIIIVILLLRPGMGSQYSYNRGSLFTASAVPMNYSYGTTSYSQPSYPSTDIMRTYGHPITVYTYPVTHTYDYTYTTPSQQSTYYPDGCTAYTTYSATTGYPCH